MNISTLPVQALFSVVFLQVLLVFGDNPLVNQPHLIFSERSSAATTNDCVVVNLPATVTVGNPFQLSLSEHQRLQLDQEQISWTILYGGTGSGTFANERFTSTAVTPTFFPKRAGSIQISVSAVRSDSTTNRDAECQGPLVTSVFTVNIRS